MCQQDYECKSKYCKNGYCRGQQMGESCMSHEDCDVELACKAQVTWPFATICQRLGLHGDPCSTDFDCHPKAYCWYKYAADLKTGYKRCLTKYSQETGTNFGWESITGNQLDDAVRNGKFCKTGWAWNSDGADTAQCTKITSVVTDMGTEMKTPYECTATMDNNYCQYYLDFSNNNYLSGQCECALDDYQGFCRYPGQIETYTFIGYVKVLDENNHCHTLDRDNMKAQLECGLGKSEAMKNAV